jgi:hypothetical protein
VSSVSERLVNGHRLPAGARAVERSGEEAVGEITEKSRVEVRPGKGGFEVVPNGHRRGPAFVDCEAAILHGEGLAIEVLVLNRQGKVERTVRSRGILAALVAEHYEALAGDARKDCDAHWQISCRWSYGRPVGWFVEPDGYCYDGFEGEHGKDGPYPSREDAELCMAAHLRAAISQARGRCG